MVIQCERCSRLYELDEALLSPDGSEVQCTRCQHVFLAYPPRSAGRTLVGMPEQPGTPAEPVRTAAAAAQREPEPPQRPPPPESDAGPARFARVAPPPVYRPSGPAPAVRAPVLKRDTVGAFEARLRWHARWRWLGPTLAAVLVVLVAAGLLLLRRRSVPGAAGSRVEALALVALDDTASVDDGIARLDAVLKHSPRDATAAGDRALAQVIRAAAVVDEGEGLAGRLAARSAERERLRRERPRGWEDAERAAAADTHALEAEVRKREENARAICRSAFEVLLGLQHEGGERPEVLRGLAAYYAIGGERERALKEVRSARERGPADGWIDLAEAWAEARDPNRAARELALVKLGAVASAHPELLHARFLLARTQAALGRRGEALATLEGLLAANPRHEGAKRAKAELLLTPPETPAAVNAAAPSRNSVAQPAAPGAGRRAQPEGGDAPSRSTEATTSGPRGATTRAVSPAMPPPVTAPPGGAEQPVAASGGSPPNAGDGGPVTGQRPRAKSSRATSPARPAERPDNALPPDGAPQ